jgi:hypothetical protein
MGFQKIALSAISKVNNMWSYTSLPYKVAGYMH